MEVVSSIIQVNMTTALKGKTVEQVTRMLKRAGVKLDLVCKPVALAGRLVYSGSASEDVKKKLAANVTFFSNPRIGPIESRDPRFGLMASREALRKHTGLAAKCRNCKKTKGDHQANTLLCPRGKKTRIGYTTYGPTSFVEKDRKA